MTRHIVAAAITLLCGVPARALAVDASANAHQPVGAGDASYTYMVGPFIAEYEPPPAGSYSLPVIDRVDDHALLDSAGGATTLRALKGERLAVVAFVYTTCGEAAGCPLAEAIMQRLDRRLADDAALARRVRLLTISFEPARDTPAHMATTRTAFESKTNWPRCSRTSASRSPSSPTRTAPGRVSTATCSRYFCSTSRTASATSTAPG